MSVLGSQLEIDLDPENEMAGLTRHVGSTGTGCYKLHNHRIKDNKKPPNIPVSEKVEATYMYAPTPPEPDTPEEEEPPDSPNMGPDGTPAKGDGDGGDTGSEDKKPKNGKAGGKSAVGSRNGSDGGTQGHTPHLLDAPLIPGGANQPDTPALTHSSNEKNASSPKSMASVGVSSYFVTPPISYTF